MPLLIHKFLFLDVFFQKKEALIIYDKNKNKKTYTFEKLDILIENFSYQLFKYKLSSKDIVAIHASASIESAAL